MPSPLPLQRDLQGFADSRKGSFALSSKLTILKEETGCANNIPKL